MRELQGAAPGTASLEMSGAEMSNYRVTVQGD